MTFFFMILTAVTCIPISFIWFWIRFFYVDIPKIKGIPEIPNGSLLAGHLYKLGKDHATTAEEWAQQYGWPVFQMRMGYRRAIVINGFEEAREWIIKNQSSTLDRPWLYTFHGVVSATSAATIGTSPWDERTKKQRRIVGSFTTGPSIQNLRNMLDMETGAMIAGLFHDGHQGAIEIKPHVYQQRLALNTMTTFCYGTRFSSVADPLLLRILEDASTIASFRSTNSNAQDFLPHLRYTAKSSGSRTATAVEVRARRDTWLAAALDKVRESARAPPDEVETEQSAGPKKSVARMLLEDNEEGLTKLDIKTILGGLMSGGFETMYATAIIAIAMLSSSEGQAMQEAAYQDIMSVYETPEQAFELCVGEEKSPYVAGLVKEALRFYPPLKLLPARQTYKEFECGGGRVPKGVLVYLNAQAINRGNEGDPDTSIYGPDADQFRPERWSKKGGSAQAIPPPYHFSYGAGARMCTAVNFSNRVLYAAILRLVVSFHMTAGRDMPPSTHYTGYKRNPAEATAIPALFETRFVPRDVESLRRCLGGSQERLAGYMTGKGREELLG